MPRSTWSEDFLRRESFYEVRVHLAKPLLLAGAPVARTGRYRTGHDSRKLSALRQVEGNDLRLEPLEGPRPEGQRVNAMADGQAIEHP